MSKSADLFKKAEELKKQEELRLLENQLWIEKNQLKIIEIKNKEMKLKTELNELELEFDNFDENRPFKEYRSLEWKVNDLRLEIGQLKNELKELMDKEYFDYLETLRNDF